MAYRIESGRLDKAERTPQGGLRIPAAVGRTGVLTYRKADGSEWREYRPPTEAFRDDSLITLRGAPVTDLHPRERVGPDSYRAVARGHVGEDARQDADGEHIAASLYVQDADLIRGIETGERSDLSAGYDVDLEQTPGVAPDGTHYDAIQRNIRYNHVAIGPPGWGRAGATVALRLDSNLDQEPWNPPAVNAGSAKKEESGMKITIRADGVDYTVEADEGTGKALPAGLAKDRAAAEQWRKDAETQTARADAAEKERDEAKGRADGLEQQVTAAADPAAVSKLVADRVALEQRATAIKPDLKCDGLTDRAVIVGALGLEDDEKLTDDYLRGRFDTAMENQRRADGSLDLARIAAVGAGGGQVSEAELARRKMIQRNRDAWKGGN
jgi:hypothetical protein